MNYSRVYIDAIGYELAPIVVTSDELEERLAPVYKALRFPAGQLEAMTGIVERRWWEPNDRVSLGAGVWALAAAVMLAGLAMFELVRRRFAVKWDDTQESIEKEIKRREAL